MSIKRINRILSLVRRNPGAGVELAAAHLGHSHIGVGRAGGANASRRIPAQFRRHAQHQHGRKRRTRFARLAVTLDPERGPILTRDAPAPAAPSR